MTKMLASVSNIEEALLALQENVDIIDLKQPALGALGALEIDDIKAIVAAIDKRSPVSATIGDLPMDADIIFNAVLAMAETGVDYIKIGFFPDANWQITINKLASLAQKNMALIAVLFADQKPDFDVISALKIAGFTGVMLDTMDKTKGSLHQVMNTVTIQQFATLAKSNQLLCGLAGSLTLNDIPILLGYQADYLGFRTALCVQNHRTGQLSQQAVQHVKQAITRC
jgi:(5-formylfuran-3-yl)methyl phosphate synthase